MKTKTITANSEILAQEIYKDACRIIQEKFFMNPVLIKLDGCKIEVPIWFPEPDLPTKEEMQKAKEKIRNTIFNPVTGRNVTVEHDSEKIVSISSNCPKCGN